MKKETIAAVAAAGVAAGALYYLWKKRESNGDGEGHFVCTKNEYGVNECTWTPGPGVDECTTSYDCPCSSDEECPAYAHCLHAHCLMRYWEHHLDYTGKRVRNKTWILSSPSAVKILYGNVKVERPGLGATYSIDAWAYFTDRANVTHERKILRLSGSVLPWEFSKTIPVDTVFDVAACDTVRLSVEWNDGSSGLKECHLVLY
ncbi:MAG: hypothetical protein PHU95_02225 [Candidatus Thermoplasmatota archaeon]|nr:hypothetical protein [Candidatus Thermoplasmatota archaeon]MDD5778248.1 hypothetical protein [Candidatus Thermoplasmatota archaeon]